jgi:propanediol dehydratase small subunit
MSDDLRQAESQIPATDLTLENLAAGKIAASDLTIRREALLGQAALADRQGYPELARNFRRAAELMAIPNAILLEIYEKLRPRRATYYQLLAASQELAARYDAPETAEYIRQAAEAYRAKGLLLVDDASL